MPRKRPSRMPNQQLAWEGFTVIRGAVDHVAMDSACEALVDWHTSHEVTDDDRHCHAPEFVAAGGLAEVSERVHAIVEPFFGTGNAKGRALQLLSSLGGKTLVPRHRNRHIDNHPNALKAAEEQAKGKEISPDDEPIDFPQFNAITCLALTETWVTIWTGSHTWLRKYFRVQHNHKKKSLREMLTGLDDYLAKGVQNGGYGSEVIYLKRGDLLIMNHLMMHASCDPDTMTDPMYHVPNKGELSARLYQRYQTLNPPPGIEALLDPWHGCSVEY